MTKEELLEALQEHLRIEIYREEDYDTFGSQTDMRIKLIWTEGKEDTTLCQDWITLSRRTY